MRLPRLRFNLWRMMVAVAIAASAASILKWLGPTSEVVILPMRPGYCTPGFDLRPIPWHHDARVYVVATIAFAGCLRCVFPPVNGIEVGQAVDGRSEEV